MNYIEHWGNFLKNMAKELHIDQQDIAAHIGVSPQVFSLKLKDDDVKIKFLLAVLAYFKTDIISVLYTPEEIKNYLPPYITPDDAEIIRELNEKIPEEKRNASRGERDGPSTLWAPMCPRDIEAYQA